MLAKKTVNALIPEAEIGSLTKFVLDKAGAKATGIVLETAKRMMGGLWVGGTAIIQQDAFVFRPNWMNRLVHKANYVVEIPFDKIVNVNIRAGIATNIIDVITGDGKFSVRCYGAENFADKIRKQKSLSIPA